ncbi:unnamed protein product [Nippostrongylus brasiliensis]|uniref:Transmembrane protein 120 homolog (inferred by orthology to a D. melanogaster protein) n=1 Tax=Nippostrongylus brasiliensis TaxID=27835 RepID=A0A0N4YPM6_NIPBR|nr:unnamed protein product [Nippostrongylus brasiliensis]
MAIDQLSKEWDDIVKDLESLEEVHHEYNEKLAELTKLQASCLKSVKHHNYVVRNFRESLQKAEKSASSDQEKAFLARVHHELVDDRTKVNEMMAELPVQNNGFYLSLILGKNLNLSLLTKNDKYKYKEVCGILFNDYEQFKFSVTLAIIAVAVISILFPWRVIDSIGNFLLV